MKVVGAIAVLVLIPLIVMAVHGSSPWLAKKLVRQAARRLPALYADRYEEEWLAELDAMPDGGLAALVFAFFIRVRIGSMERRLGALMPAPVLSDAVIEGISAALNDFSRTTEGTSTEEVGTRSSPKPSRSSDPRPQKASWLSWRS